MARKRLSDVLREEAQKTDPESTTEQFADAQPAAKTENGRSTTTKSSSAKSSTKPATSRAASARNARSSAKTTAAPDPELAKSVEKASVEKASVDKASVDKEVDQASAEKEVDQASAEKESIEKAIALAAELTSTAHRKLETDLAAAHTREADLQQQITDLKADLKAHTGDTKKLQTNLEVAEQRIHQLQAELDDTKQTALQLAETNTHLQSTLDQLKTPAATPAARAPQSSAPQSSAPQPLATTKPANKPAEQQLTRNLSQQEIIRRKQAQSLAHPVFPNSPLPSQTGDGDIGWFD
jgi:regulator of replication initiation timing